MRLKTRLGRLELARPVADPNEVPPYFWDVLGGAKKADDLPAAARARIEEWWPIRREESRRRRITAVRQMADTLRTEFGLVEQGVTVPTAEELVAREARERGFCAIDELLRLLPSTREDAR